MTETGAVALLYGVTKQAAQDLRSRTGASPADRLDAYEYLRHIGLARRHRLALLEEARAAQSRQRRRRPQAQPVAQNGKIWQS